MTTLNKTITAGFFKSAEDYERMKEYWAGLVTDPNENKTLTPDLFLFYAVLRGKDWRKGFAPIKNGNKLANGGKVGWCLYAALDRIHSKHTQSFYLATFGDFLAEGTMDKVRAILAKAPGYFEREKASADPMEFSPYIAIEEPEQVAA